MPLKEDTGVAEAMEEAAKLCKSCLYYLKPFYHSDFIYSKGSNGKGRGYQGRIQLFTTVLLDSTY